MTFLTETNCFFLVLARLNFTFFLYIYVNVIWHHLWSSISSTLNIVINQLKIK